jgi:hypothetical protein
LLSFQRLESSSSLLLCSGLLRRQSFRSPEGGRVTLLRGRESNQRRPPGGAVSGGILPSDFARVLRVRWMYVHVHSANGIHRVRPPADFPPHPRRLRGPVGRHPAAEANARAQLSRPLSRRSAGTHGFVDKGHRSRCRASEAWREKARRVAAMDRRDCEQYRDVLSEQPPRRSRGF